jgi:menaquinone-9 beta-reductase
LAAGIALRQHGLDVVVADALVPPIDKACGEGLMPDSRRELLRLGVELRGGREFSGVHFANRSHGREDLAAAAFSSGKGIGIRRVDLHRQLIERAEEAGVRFKWGSRVDLSGPEPTVGGQTYRYRYLVGADGEGSQVRRWAGLESGLPRSRRLGFRRHYRVAPWSDCVEFHWCDFGQAYVTPVAEGEVCVAAITSRRGWNFDKVVEGLPYLRGKLHGQETTGRDRGALTTSRRLRRVTRRNIALVGDASGSADAITGSGLASAFREALLLGESLGRGAIADYEAGHARILRLPQAMASIMMLMDRSPCWRGRIIRMLAGSPDLLAGILAVHTGEERPARFAAAQGARLGLRLLLPEVV